VEEEEDLVGRVVVVAAVVVVVEEAVVVAVEDHQVAQEVPDLAKWEEEPNWWAIPLKYSMENATEHNCSCPNGRSTGVSITWST